MAKRRTKRDPAEAQKRRWRLIHAAEIREMRRESVAEKLRQLNSLLRSSVVLGFQLEPEEVSRWDLLRRKLLAAKKAKSRSAA